MKHANEARMLTGIELDNDAKYRYYLRNIKDLVDCGIRRGEYKTCVRIDKEYLERIELYLHNFGYRTYYLFGILDIEWGEIPPELPKKIGIFEKILNYVSSSKTK